MNISEIIGKIDLPDSTPFFNFTRKWIKNVTSKKKSNEINEKEWSEIFGRGNPVAGVDWGELLDKFKTSKGIRETRERTSFKSKWDSDIRPSIEDVIETKDISEKLQKIKNLKQLIQNVITEGGGRDRTTAINRMLTTFFPDCFVAIPNHKNLSEFIDILQKEIANGSFIIKTGNWIDDSFQVKSFFDKELGDDGLTASAWEFYDYLRKNKSLDLNQIHDDTNTITMNDKYKDFLNLLLGNGNLILTGAPGTGKTYLAKEIARCMGCDKEHIGYIQFHPSYDYTDFVEGLRPIKEGETLGFQRKDGIFKAFCKKALSPSSCSSFDDVYNNLIQSISSGELTTIQLKTKHSAKLDVRESDSIGWYSETEKENKSSNVVSKQRLKKLYDAYNTIEKLDNLTNINDGIQSIIGGCDSSYYWGVLRHILLEIENGGYTVQPFVFIIDEINRGEISKIFGELFYSIDAGYRGEKGRIETQYQNLVPSDDVFSKGFYVPENVYIIGTMNDIDRSVESMDFAMRRRFAWKEITAKSSQSILDEDEAWGSVGKPSEKVIAEMKARMNNLNAAIIDQYGDEELSNKDKVGLTKAYQIGAAYFLKYSLYNNFDELWANHLEGLLHEYLRGKPNIDEKIERLRQAYNDTTTH